MACARDVSLAAKLRTMRMAKATDGETFGVLTANPLLAGPVILDLHLVEADRVATPQLKLLDAPVDGIELDAWGNPARYYVLRYHPGDLRATVNDFDVLTADSVIHWFRADRPGQHRGIPEITPALVPFQFNEFYFAGFVCCGT